ncbi:hypothetical protein CYME_CMT366C [Cyanidioschyzon merolae strain 10D]|jgi:hypothetical protein|uniref:BAR domain-containing protein n=1 Tax=Cyanidioschyzon merolae (strain NIES-3377 / 10D) TaxID=280699 RepID=M1UXT5_CYAM1|nr:hypothetical protein CYME_CMT366C [Cyanidioschyzon merolae strain 10D]BAM83316.1 hypothetical protein CYME_CMT366C [Cyanidioschyzon merolae strain 10D]|eukprot:XP_005539352.1 hypothetical protein CYME_CMT366C [Cyanidioschyzon merolae strain 10D]
MSTESRGKSVTTSVSSLYSKAKQRVLNKFGRRTHLTRNPKVDSLNEIQSGIRADESKLASRITSYRRSLRDAILSGLELQTLYLTIYKRNVGALKFNVERNEYSREPSAAQVIFIQKLEKELSEVETVLKREIDAFTARFKDYADHPLTNKTLEEADELRRVETLKADYKKARTLYSDRAIEVEAGSSNQAALTEAYQEYMRQSDLLCQEMIQYQDRVAREVGNKVRGFFEAQHRIYSTLNEQYDKLLPMARQLESLPFQNGLPGVTVAAAAPIDVVKQHESATPSSDTMSLFD